MDRLERRELLKCNANPDPGRDYISEFSSEITGITESDTATIRIRYVPDRQILEPNGVDLYFAEMSAQSWPSLEELAAHLLTDIQNEVVPRWVQIHAVIPRSETKHISRQSTRVEDTQPGWSNETLLKQLRE